MKMNWRIFAEWFLGVLGFFLGLGAFFFIVLSFIKWELVDLGGFDFWPLVRLIVFLALMFGFAGGYDE